MTRAGSFSLHQMHLFLTIQYAIIPEPEGEYYLAIPMPRLVNTIIRGNELYDLYLQDGLSHPNFFNCLADRNRLAGLPFYGAWENILNTDPAFINPTLGTGISFDALSAYGSCRELHPV